jgi:hypothetical protein
MSSPQKTRSKSQDRKRDENGRKARDGARTETQISNREVEDIEERSSPRTPVIYEIVRRDRPHLKNGITACGLRRELNWVKRRLLFCIGFQRAYR